ncbi:CD63 antigen-like [Cololabis saira]|uniref:CD63 antigen-like n=1 Tax=Cololabis saira TaxID=129043 RepID=UPI002AD438D8|nr:CD63 antigen-like [Cololabis saira]
MSSCCSIKCCFIFFNTLFLASGIILIIIGALQYSSYSQIGTIIGQGLSEVVILLITVGVIITVVSLLGHFGAWMNNPSMLSCFVLLLIVMIMFEIAIGAAFYVFRSKNLLQTALTINSKAHEVFNQYSPDKRHAINKIQEKFHCCGAESSTDWSKSEGWENHDAVPDSCCITKTAGCGLVVDTNIHTKGCIGAIKSFLTKNLLWIGGVCIALGVTEVFGVFLGLCLCVKIKGTNYESFS